MNALADLAALFQVLGEQHLTVVFDGHPALHFRAATEVAAEFAESLRAKPAVCAAVLGVARTDLRPLPCQGLFRREGV